VGLGCHAARVYNLATSTLRRTLYYYRHTYSSTYHSSTEIAYAYHTCTRCPCYHKLHTYIQTHIHTSGECLWLPAAIFSFRLMSRHLRQFTHISPHKEPVNLTDLSTLSCNFEICARSFSGKPEELLSSNRNYFLLH